MAYVINKFNGDRLTILEDGTKNESTSLGLVGRNYVGYGEIQNENFVFLLENFANSTAPSKPLAGQTWYNTSTKTLNVYSGTGWAPAGGAAVSNTAPNTAIDAASTNPIPGALWFKNDTNQLYVSDGTEWNLIGPDAIENFGITKLVSRPISDVNGVQHPAALLYSNDEPIAIYTSDSFTINTSENLVGYTSLVRGINLKSGTNLNGSVLGNSTSATRLENYVNINGIPFNGTQSINIKSSTTNTLSRGTYLIGNNFDGSSATTWSVDASSTNVIGKVVVRDSSGNFSAGTVTADLIGDVTGNVTSISGTSRFDVIEANTFVGNTLTGNARTASRLATPVTINGVSFDGSANITVPASANTLTGNTIPSNVTQSSLTSIGTLADLNVGEFGVKIGSGQQLKLYLDSNNPTIESTVANGSLSLEINDSPKSQNNPAISFVSSAQAVILGGDNNPAFTKTKSGAINLGLPDFKWNTVYATEYQGSVSRVSSLYPTVGGTTITANADVIITGNLTIQGTTLSVNSTVVNVADKTLTLASGSPSSAAADQSGLLIDGSFAEFYYRATGDKWVSNKDIDVGSNKFRGRATSAEYADLAENYVADNLYEPGTVLAFGGEFEVTLAEDETRAVAGIVSTNPAYLMNSECKGKYVTALALEGRVPCKVRGKIRKGDLLTSGGNGYARPSMDPKIGTIVGKALEDFDGTEGIIEVVVSKL
jgi:hypothetical protein